MKKRILLNTSMLLTLMSLAELQAASLTPIDNGCDRLRDIVVAQVATLSVKSREPSLLRESKNKPVIPDPPEYCMDTAAATSAAFSSAMHAAGMPVRWGAEAGDSCTSRSLSLCYPRPVHGDMATASELGFLYDAWNAVSSGVAAAMPYGVASDMTVFDANDLAVSIRRGDQPKDQRIISPVSAVPQE